MPIDRVLKEANHWSILIVDDNPDICQLLHETLSYEGYTVATTASGQDSLREFQQKLPDLVLLDLKMPKINGFEIGQKFKEINKNINIVVMSGYISQQNVEKVIAKGFVNDILTKPFDLEELKKIVRNLLTSTP
ncbi:response regulator [Desulfosporosinus sp. PR]|uniref:response regulator n=1 Tax=Candidatus Desulfosporosinus nitrosoreducens TaxID=3401928 RepID=UPI0027F2DCFD|nr:response regulator [Desulfosporosinus sp. PR]MDQ7095268.1 response regulator [Desulfosporosinus sp. PR]